MWKLMFVMLTLSPLYKSFAQYNKEAIRDSLIRELTNVKLERLELKTKLEEARLEIVKLESKLSSTSNNDISKYKQSDSLKQKIASLKRAKNLLSTYIQIAANKNRRQDSLITELKTIEDTLRRELMASSFKGVLRFKVKRKLPIFIRDGKSYWIKVSQVMKIKSLELTMEVGVRKAGIKRILPQPIVDFDAIYTEDINNINFNEKLDLQANPNIKELYKAKNISLDKENRFKARILFNPKNDFRLRRFRQAIKEGKSEYLIIRVYYTQPNTQQINVIKVIKCKIQT